MHRASNLIETLEIRRFLAAAAGDPDATFGVDGLRPVAGPGFIQFVGNDGDFLQINEPSVQKHDAAGALVTDYGVNGTATMPISALPVVLGDGAMLLLNFEITGDTGEDSDQTYFLARVDADGMPDANFGDNGVVNLDLLLGDHNDFLRVAAQSDGKILLETSSDGPDHIYRLNTDGTVDSTFHRVDIDDPGDTVSITVLPDDKFFFVTDRGRQNGHDFALARFNADGALDTSFASGGYLAPMDSDILSGNPFHPSEILPLPGGGFLLSGEGHVFKYHADGSPDSSFHVTSNNQLISQLDGFSAVGDGLVAAKDGKFIVWGSTILRLNADGSLDQSFGRVVSGVFGGGPGFSDLVVTDSDDLLVAVSTPFDTPDKDRFLGIYKLLGAADLSAPATAVVSLDQSGVLSALGSDQPDRIVVEDVFEANLESGEEGPPTGDIVAVVQGKLGRMYDVDDVQMISVIGGAGNDNIEISTARARCTVSGGDGNDLIVGGAESDSLSGNAGRDTILGGQGDDRVAGNGGRDKLFGDNDEGGRDGGADRLLGGAGADWLYAGQLAHDTLTGGGGNDILVAPLNGGAVLHGNAGDDYFVTNSFGDSDPDSLFGDAGHDTAVVNDFDSLLSIEESTVGPNG